jgi:hypothetical protein
MPVQKLPGGLEGDDGGGKSVASRIFTEERGKSLPGAQGELGEKPASMPECRPQDLGEREDFDAGGGRGGSPAPGRIICPGEAVEIMVKDSVEGGPLGLPGAVEFRFIES